MLFRFLEKDSYEKWFQVLRSTLLSGIGVLFILVGILLALNGRYMEFGVEFFIGVPILWYGLMDVKEYESLQIGLIAFVIFSEIVSVLSFVMA